MNQVMGIPDDQEGVRDVLRGIMRTFTWLQQLILTNEQWEDILPKREVLELAALEYEVC